MHLLLLTCVKKTATSAFLAYSELKNSGDQNSNVSDSFYFNFSPSEPGSSFTISVKVIEHAWLPTYIGIILIRPTVSKSKKPSFST